MRAYRLMAVTAALLPLAAAQVSISARDLTVPRNPKEGWEYLGCYVDSVAERVLNRATMYDTEGLTAETCIEFCEQAGFQYAGLEYTAECFCGNDRPLEIGLESECNMPCSGDEDEPCGGPNRLTVFTSDLLAPAVAGWKYSGCYRDSVSSRALTGAYYADGDDMTPETCISFCEDRSFRYAGVEYGAECFCGNTLTSEQEDDSECDMACAGDSEKKCGAGNRMSVFLDDSRVIEPEDPGTPPDIEGWFYNGCIKEGDGGRVLAHQVFLDEPMTNQRCVAACQRRGFTLAGTEYAGECFCGDEYDNDGGEIDDKDGACNMRCAGDRRQFCGGSNRLSSWSFGTLSETSSGVVPSDTVSSTASESASATASDDEGGASNSASATVSDDEGVSATASATESDDEDGVSATASSTESDDETTASATVSDEEVVTTTSAATTESDEEVVTTTSAASTESDEEVAVTTSAAATTESDEEVVVTTSAAATESDEEVVTTSAAATESEDEVVATTSAAATESDEETVVTTSAAATESDEEDIVTTTSASPTVSDEEAVSSTSASASSSASSSALPGAWEYQGCWIDPPGRAMAGAPGSPSQTMTPQSCMATCEENGFIIAGVQYSEECFCGNSLNNEASETAESDCNMRCAGDPSQICGAGNRFSLYARGEVVVNPIPRPKVEDLPEDWEYKGCVFDNNSPYVLEWLWEDSGSYATSNMSINFCLERCQKWGYSAAGVEYGRQCVCGDLGAVESRGSDVWKDDGFCNMPCPGDRRTTCGAGNHISYYEWVGDTPLNVFHYASGNAAGRYEHFSTGPIVPLISSVGINDKVVFVEKHGTSLDDTEGSFEFDYTTNTYRELALKTDVFCSASFTLPDKAGRMINIGGWSADSIYGIRFYTPDSPQGVDNGSNVWEEDFSQLRLFDPRWYPTALVLSNGSLLAMGGESGSDAPIVPTCEVLPHPPGVTESTYLDYLANAEAIGRTNSYPFMAILPSGNIFFAQFNESRIISQSTFQTVRQLPDMPGSVKNPLTGRNYPLQGTMMIMPQKAPYTDPLEILLCGGTTHEPGNDALDNCVIMEPDTAGAEWQIERMPSKRVMPTMVALPDGRFVIINGAKVGRGGFGLADDANLNAVMYDPEQPLGTRMTVLANTTIARMYHSEGVLLSDGKVLVSGSDPQDEGKHPQEKRMEYFIPDYLMSGATQPRFSISDRDWAYGGTYTFTLDSALTNGASSLRVSLMASIGSTHGITMGQRTLFPEFSCTGTTCSVQAPPNSFVSPPSWYQMFVLDGPTPSHATWVRIGGDPAGLGNWPQLPGFTTPGV